MSSRANEYAQRFNIAKNRNKFFIASTVILVLGLLSMFIMGLNLGVDFKAGTRLDLYIGKEFSPADVESVIQEKLPDTHFTAVTPYGTHQAFTRFDQTISPEKLNEIQQALIEKYGDQVTRQESTVDPIIAQELARKAGIAILVAAGGIAIYVAFRFQLMVGIACAIALLHDVFIPVALFSVFRLEVDLTFIAAILTIVGYSLNDTIVIFDRIRENMRTMKSKTMEDLEHLVNLSLWQTMRRSIFTMLTVLVTAVAIVIFGSEGIRNFSLALIFGLVSGGYSSIFIAAQIWLVLKKRELNKKRFAPAPKEE
ncbi:protein translocase subunit SecF [Brevibacillus sp. TJ4]|uniref:protein translocase subunit SecF n=1 Tax=Brevibacillus sp. TJ4 TaxID=3234853 RepID=UPI003BA3D303